MIENKLQMTPNFKNLTNIGPEQDKAALLSLEKSDEKLSSSKALLIAHALLRPLLLIVKGWKFPAYRCITATYWTGG